MTDQLSPLLQNVLQWLNTNPHLAGLVTFFISTGESIALLGTIVPGSVMMTAIGALIGSGIIPLWSTLFWAILGAIVGDGISYWIGFYFKSDLHYMWPFRHYPQILAKGEYFFNKHGGKSVFIGRFIGPVRALVPLVAGMLGMRPLLFFIANVTSAIGWAPAYMLPGILLGAASLELPSDVTTHVLMMLLMTFLFILVCLWLLKTLFILIGAEIDQLLTLIWNNMQGSRLFKPLTHLIKRSSPHPYGQLVLTFYFLITCSLFTLLTLHIGQVGSNFIPLNKLFFFIFRSLRQPNMDTLMLSVTLLGDKTVLLPVFAVGLLWCAYKRYWYTFFHILAFVLFATLSIIGIKHFIHSERPWGFAGNDPTSYSFPSGHATLSFCFFMGLAAMIIHLLKGKAAKLIYSCSGLLVIAVGISRLYFGVHWFTDIIAGWLLGAAILMLVSLSFNRSNEKQGPYKGFFLTILVAFIFSYSLYYFLAAPSLIKKYARLEWPTQTISLASWWQQEGISLPNYRVNRFGFAAKLFNIQWVGDLNTIESILLKNGWEKPEKNDWYRVLFRISSVQSTNNLPLIPPLYLDKGPVLTLVKHEKKLIVIRFWQTNTTLKYSPLALWLGAIETVPSTYSWLFNGNHPNNTLVPPQLLFISPPKNYDLKSESIILNKQKHRESETILLIKPHSTI